MIESKIQKKIIDYIKNKNGDCFKISATSRRGCPDLIALINGNVVLIEVKQEGKPLDPLQEYFFNYWNSKNINCIKVESITSLLFELSRIGVFI